MAIFIGFHVWLLSHFHFTNTGWQADFPALWSNCHLPKEFSAVLYDDDVAELQALADSLDFRATMSLFSDLLIGDAGIPQNYAEALRAMANAARERFGRPAWKEDAVIQLHIDYRCIRGGRTVLETAKDTFATAVKAGRPSCRDLPLTSISPRGNGIAVPLRLTRNVGKRLGDTTDLEVTSFVLELGPAKVQAKMVVTRPPAMASAALLDTVVAEDFGFRNTSSIAVLRGSAPIGQAALEHVSGHNGGDVSKLSKTASKKFLAEHVSGDETELLELVQFDGKDFLDRIKEQAKKVDGLRSESDRLYNRLGRIRTEINRVAGLSNDDLVPEVVVMPDHPRYVAMHSRFFRLLAAVGKLKAKRRAVYRAVAGLKTSWFGYVAQRKADLAEKYGAAVVAEDLDIVAVPTDDPAYKGRTFNKMINNGSKGQYNLRSDNTLKWRGIPSVKIPSYYTSSTDWRTGTVDKAQRHGETFKAVDGRRWDADLHAAEMIGRYLLLRPKTNIEPAALAA